MKRLSLPRRTASLLACLALSAALPALADGGAIDYRFRPVPDIRADASQPVPKFQFLFGLNASWQLPYRWKYNHADAPGSFAGDKAGTLAQIRARLDHWTASCGFTHVYEGETNVAPDTRIQHPQFGEQPDGLNVVGWGPLDAGTGGVTNAWYATVNGVPRLTDADVTLSNAITLASRLTRVATHEWGHALGLGHSNVPLTLMSGPPDTEYASFILDAIDDDRNGCRCLYGPPAGQTAGLLCELPKRVDFGTVQVNTTPIARTFEVKNTGNAPLTVATVLAETPEVIPQGGCPDGTVLAPGAQCTLQATVRAQREGSRAPSVLLRTSDGDWSVPLAYFGTLAPPGAGTAAVVEYYNATLDHYFVSSLAADIQALDSGQLKGWARTGLTFKAYPSLQPGTSPVCRFYLPPVNGDSHFYSASPAECAEVAAKFPSFVYESQNVMFVALPDTATGACPSGTLAVYRLWNNRVDSNHRYTADPAVKAQMLARGYVAEGYGPNAVIMCAPA